MTWNVLSIIGTIAFAVSGSLVAIKEDYDLLGIYLLGFTTAFGGGLIRNLLVGIPVQQIWKQSSLFITAFFVITGVFIAPNVWEGRWKKSIILFDAIGLAAFSIQGANAAATQNLPDIAIILAAILTGAGGGMLRDLFAGRKPMLFHSEVYGLWAGTAGWIIGLELIHSSLLTYLLFLSIVVMRVLSVHCNWNLPRYIRKIKS